MKTLWLVAAVTLVIGLAGLIAIVILYEIEGPIPLDYGIVIDCGSSHSNLYVYHWKGNKLFGTGVVEEIYECEAAGAGITSYANNPSLAGKSLRKCLQEAQKKVPKESHSETPVYLGATAGMRMFAERMPKETEEIIASLRSELRQSSFLFDNETYQARIISGSEEGACGWITLNYLLKKLDYKRSSNMGIQSRPSSELAGALDMGGASTQISFIPDQKIVKAIPNNFSEELTLYGDSFDLYTHSFLCYGLDQAELKFKAELIENSGKVNEIEDPCLPSGYNRTLSISDIFLVPCTKKPTKFNSNVNFTFYGASKYKQCAETVKELFNFKKCSYANDRCSFNGQFQPSLRGKFVSFAGYYYIMDFVFKSATRRPTELSEYRTAVQMLCNSSWDEVRHMNTSKKDSLPDYCFDAQYILTIITEGYGFNESSWKDISFQRKINGQSTGWTLGYMINATTALPPSAAPRLLPGGAVFIGLLLLLSIVVCVAVIIACIAHRRHPSPSHGRTTSVNVDAAQVNSTAEYQPVSQNPSVILA